MVPGYLYKLFGRTERGSQTITGIKKSDPARCPLMFVKQIQDFFFPADTVIELAIDFADFFERSPDFFPALVAVNLGREPIGDAGNNNQNNGETASDAIGAI
jgi:hypothetical protein